MNPQFRKISVAALLVLMLSACATDDLLGRKATSNENLADAKQKLAQNPKDVAALTQEAYARLNRITELLSAAEDARKAGNAEEARNRYGEVLQIEPGNPRAQSGLRLLEDEARHQRLVSEARNLFELGNLDSARAKLRPVLIENPSQAEARTLMQEIEDKAFKDQVTPRKLKPPKNKTVTLEFRDANLRNIFEVISRTSGINFVLDPTIKPDLKATIFVKDASVEEAIDFLLMMHQMSKKVLTENSLLIYPQNRAAQYEDLTLRTYYLNYSDAKQTAAYIKSMLPIKDVYVDEKLNMISLKAPFDQLQNVDRLIADSDIAEPEVMLDVEVLEVNRTLLKDIGITYPDTFSVLGGSGPDGVFTWYDLKHNINSQTVAVSPAPVIKLIRTDGVGDLLANPRIRVKNREKAKIHIGTKIPIINTTIPSGNSSFATQSANYTDVGLMLEVEPRVMLNSDVSIKLNLEVSSVVDKVVVVGPPQQEFPVIGSRKTSTNLMSADNETQVLAGLINDEDRKNAKKVPWISEIPLVGQLFSTHYEDRRSTEIVLLITPHVVRNVLRPEARSAEFYGGTAGGRTGPVNINPTAILQQFTGGAVPARQAAPPAGAATPAAPAESKAPEIPEGAPQPLGKPLGQE